MAAAPDLSPTKAQILQSSQAGWSPLRIQKRSPSPIKSTPTLPAQTHSHTTSTSSAPSDGRPTAVGADGTKRTPSGARRTSASFSHLRSHSLVSNSPFKSPETAQPIGAKYKPRPQSAYGYVLKHTDGTDGTKDGREGRKVSAGLGISGAGLSPVLSEVGSPDPAQHPQVQLQQQQRKNSASARHLPNLSEAENEDPSPRIASAEYFPSSHSTGDAGGAKRQARKSRGLQELPQLKSVTRSPFLPDGDPTSPNSRLRMVGEEAGAGDSYEEELGGELRKPGKFDTPPALPPKEKHTFSSPATVLPTPESEVVPPLEAPAPPKAQEQASTPRSSPTKHHPSLNASPRRPALTSYRLHGPRTNSSTAAAAAGGAGGAASGQGQRRVSSNASRRRRRRNKKVTFDERCDVVEFERDEPSEEEGEEGEGEWTEGSESEREIEGTSELEVEGELREWEGRLRVVNADAHEDGEHEPDAEGDELHGLVSQLVASPLPPPSSSSTSPSPLPPRSSHLHNLHEPNADFLSPNMPGLGAQMLRDTSIDRIERDVESILRDASLLMPASTPREELEGYVTPQLGGEAVFSSSARHGEDDGEGDTSMASFVSGGTVEIHDDEGEEEEPVIRRYQPSRGRPLNLPKSDTHNEHHATKSDREGEGGGEGAEEKEHSFIHSQSHVHPDLSSITPSTDGAPFTPDLSLASQRSAPGSKEVPSTPPRGSPAKLPVTPSTPPNRERMPHELAEDAEDGVPLGRTHHAARAAELHHQQHHTALHPHTQDGLAPTPVLPDLAPTSPFVFSPALPSSQRTVPGQEPQSPTTTQMRIHSPRLTKEEVRARLRERFTGNRRTATPTSPGKLASSTGGTDSPQATPEMSVAASPATTHSTQSTPVPNLFGRGGPESPVPVEHAGPPGAREVDIVHPSREGTPVRKEKALPPPPPPGSGSRSGDGEGEGMLGRPELRSAESGGSVVGVRSGLERLVEGVRQQHGHSSASGSPSSAARNANGNAGGTGSPNNSPSLGKTRRVPVPSFDVHLTTPSKRGADEEEEEDLADSPKRLAVPQRRPGRRRSLSTGDVQKDEKEEETQLKGKKSILLPTPVIASDPFSDTVEREVRKYIDGPRSYQIREHEVKVFTSPADREKVGHVQGAGDVDKGKAWKVIRRSSDMNEYAREIRELRKSDKSGKALGKVFVRVLGVKGLNVPLPREPTFFTVTLNNGIHAVTTPEAALEKDAVVEQEFELIEHPKLEFTLTLKVRMDEHILAQLRPPPPPPVSLPSRDSVPSVKSATPTHRSGFRALFGSPKKSKQQAKPASVTPPMSRAQSEMPAPVQPDCLAKHVAPDGTLAQASVTFKEIARRCDTRLFETAYPLMERSTASAPDTVTGASVAVYSSRVVGEIILQLFRLPPLPGIEQDALPQSLEECHRGLRHVAWHKALYHEGTLTQNGGDCSTWRRRRFRVVGAEMIATNDVTKKITATIDLKKAVSLEDDQDPALKVTSGQNGITRSMSSDDDLYSYTGVQRSFRIIFQGGDEIGFFADTDDEKAKWMQVLNSLIGRIPDHPLWAEMLWQRQEDLAKQAANKSSPHKR